MINNHCSSPFLKSATVAVAMLSLGFGAGGAQAEEYNIDTMGKHAFIHFKVSHLGYSYVLGDFPDFDGTFNYDSDNPADSAVNLNVDTTTVDTRHAERNVHVRSADFLNVKKFPNAKFVSTGYVDNGGGQGELTGDLTLRGVTKPVTVQVNRIGEGKDPWGGYRAGFEGNATLTMADYGIDYNLGPASKDVELYFSIEGVRQ